MMQNQIYNNTMPNQMNNGMIQNTNQNQIYNGIKKTNQNNFFNQIQTQINNRNINNYIKNIPLENAVELKLDGNKPIKYYLYPEIDFTKEELNNSKVLLIIGQTGHGKTTFINALINIYLGITINDNFRYLLVQNEKNDQLKSITKEITVYKIRSKEGLNFPPLIIIDTPGFGDTGGEKEDKLNLEKFKTFFESKKINYINCILYMIIGAYARFGENDKIIINHLLDLFSKNLKENFVVGVTNYIQENKNDIPNIIKSLSNENHFYYQNVLKSDNYSREQVINENWYFSSDNKIISDNNIERNEKNKEKWKYTEMQIKNFIESKIKILEKKNIDD
jgi:energy-coupling factor transporter ATP-binding protein EcfA2